LESNFSQAEFSKDSNIHDSNDYNSRTSSLKERGIDIRDQPNQAAGDQDSIAGQAHLSVNCPVDRKSKWKPPVDRPESRKSDQRTESLRRSTS